MPAPNLILVTLDNEDDAYLIFETLNTRGKDLALSDLIRNHFTKFIRPIKGVDQSKIKWTKVIDTIADSPVRLDPDTFIVHSWQSRYDFVSKAKIFKRVKSNIKAKNANEHLNRFITEAEQWRAIFDTEYMWTKGEKDISRSLDALRIFKVVQPTPGILSLIRSYKDDKIKLKLLRNALQAIERFHYSFNAVTSSRSSGGISGMYSSFGRSIFEASDSNEVGILIEGLIEKLREKEVPYSEFDAGFGQIIFTKQHSLQKPIVQYTLKKISKIELQTTIGDSEDLTIEHLRPESMITDRNSANLIGQIGNLMLVDKDTNNKLGTLSFSEKKIILKEAGYKIPAILEDTDELSDEVIIENTRRLSELARGNFGKV